MKPRQWNDALYGIAESQLGYFTAAQARGVGVHPVRLIQLHQSGDIERVSRGVYRLVRFPVSPLGQYMEAALWPQVRRSEARAVISHASALALYELSEVSPAKIHLTLDPQVRLRREIPPELVFHFAPLAADDIQFIEGVPVTTPERTIRDAYAAHLGAALIRRAIADGRRNGRLTQDTADRLTRELLAESPPKERKSTKRRAVVGTSSTRTHQKRRSTAKKGGVRRR